MAKVIYRKGNRHVYLVAELSINVVCQCVFDDLVLMVSSRDRMTDFLPQAF
jgi:hypothetical protein